RELLDLVGPDIEPLADQPGRRRVLAAEGKRVSQGRQRLLPIRCVLDARQRAPGGERSLPIVGSTVGMVDDVAGIRKTGRDRVEVSGSDRGLDAGSVRGRGVLPHAADALLHWSGWHYEPRQRRFGGQLVEARERLGLAIDIEHLAARNVTIGSEDQETEDLCLPGAATGAVGAEARRAPEERVRPSTEDVVEADDGDIDELEPGAPVPQEFLRPMCRPGPQDPVVD